MSKKRVVTILFVIAVVLLAIKGRGLLKSRQQEIKNQPLPKLQELTVKLGHAKNGMLYQLTPFLARVEADKSIKLSTKLAGFVKKVYVKEAQSVKKGDTLVKIDAKELNANLDSLNSALIAQENDLSLAKKIYQRNVKLYKVGAIAKEMLETSKVGLKMKKSVVESTKQKIVSLKNQLLYLDIKAPFDGKIDAIILHEGDLAVTGKPILSMSTDKKKLLFSYAPTKDLIIKPKQKVLKGKKIVGEIKTIYNMANNGLSTAEVSLKEDMDEPIGSSVNISVVTKYDKGCVVWSDAILHKKDGEYIFVYKDNEFVPTKVKTVIENDEKVIISPCTNLPYARASEAKLALLPSYKKVNIAGEGDE